MAPRLLLVLAAAILGVSAVEAGLRIAGVSYIIFEMPDLVRGTSLRPLTQGWYNLEGHAFVAINSHGYRDRERRTEKEKGDYRVAVIGDSFVEARQVALDDTFCAVLERLLAADPRFAGRSVEVMNFGVAGYGTAQEWLTLKHDVLAFEPDQVVLAFFTGNDVADNAKGLSHPLDTRPYYELRGDALLLDSSFVESPTFRDRQGRLASLFYTMQEHSRIVQVGYRASRMLGRALTLSKSEPVSPFNQPGLSANVYLEPVNELWKNAWRVTERLLVALKAECEAQGIGFSVVTLSNPPQANPDRVRRSAYERKLGVPDLFYPDRQVAAIGERAGFRVLTLAPIFQSYADEHQVLLHGFPNIEPGMGHWNEQGHRLAAKVIAEWLQPESR
jgi:GDSL-like Lipase/Acylhydrolase